MSSFSRERERILIFGIVSLTPLFFSSPFNEMTSQCSSFSLLCLPYAGESSSTGRLHSEMNFSEQSSSSIEEAKAQEEDDRDQRLPDDSQPGHNRNLSEKTTRGFRNDLRRSLAFLALVSLLSVGAVSLSRPVTPSKLLQVLILLICSA